MDSVERIAEVVLYEGYLLYPYRQSAMKNQQRWTFGGVYPRSYSEASSGDEPWHMQTQCLVVGDEETVLAVTVRFLQVVERSVIEGAPAGPAVAALRVRGQVYRPGEEAMERDVVLGSAPGDAAPRLGALVEHSLVQSFAIPAGSADEPLRDPTGEVVGMLTRRWCALHGEVEVTAEPRGTSYRLTARIINTTPWTRPRQEGQARIRQDALGRTFVSTHTILRVQGGSFVSLLEPPPEHQEAAAACVNLKTWPVLVGEEGERHTLLSSPIILYDYPRIAPESHGNFFDATEIDELMTLSIMTLTDEEKQEMRESDSRTRAMLERTEALSAEQLMKLHGAISQPTAVAPRAPGEEGGGMNSFWEREAAPPPPVRIDGVEITKGSRVRLHPRPGGDVLDIVLAGKVAYVEAIERDFEDQVHISVTVEDDPGRDLGDARQPGHRFFFALDEVEPLGREPRETP